MLNVCFEAVALFLIGFGSVRMISGPAVARDTVCPSNGVDGVFNALRVTGEGGPPLTADGAWPYELTVRLRSRNVSDGPFTLERDSLVMIVEER